MKDVRTHRCVNDIDTVRAIVNIIILIMGEKCNAIVELSYQ